MLDYDAFRRDQAAARDDGRLLGVGIACYVEPTAGGFGVGITESTTIRIDPSGSIQVISGVNSQGHSMETIIAQVTAEYLGVDVDDVEVMFGDTAIAPMGATTGGSRNAVFGGGAARQAALEMRERVFADRRPHARGLPRRPRAWKVAWSRCGARRRRRRRSPRSRTSPT